MSTDPESELESILVSSISSDDIASLGKDYLELGIDALLAEGVLREIPLVSTFVNVYGAFQTIQSKLFFKKILRFVISLSDLPLEVRQAQVEKLIEDPKERKVVGENILLILDKLNNVSKPEMLAKAFAAFLEEKISRSDFYSLAHAIEQINVSAIPALMHRGSMSAHREHLMSCGLLSLRFTEIESGGGAIAGPTRTVRRPAGEVTINECGHLFINIVLSSSP